MEQILKIAATLNLPVENNYIRLFHGTSKGNQTKIIKQRKFKGFPWFAPDIETAQKFSRQAGGVPVVMEVWVNIESLYYNGYFTTKNPIKLVESNKYS